jgi:hypothetical protein
MEVEYSLTAEDLRAFARYHGQLRSVRPIHSLAAVLGLVVVIMVVCAVVSIGFNYLGALRGELFDPFMMGLAFGAIGQALALRWWQGYVKRATWKTNCEDKRNEWAIRQVRVTISPGELRSVTRGSTNTYQWSLVWRIGVTSSHIFVYLTTSNAILIPRRAFGDHAHSEAFIALARQYQQDWREEEQKSTDILAGLPPASSAITRPDAS